MNSLMVSSIIARSRGVYELTRVRVHACVCVWLISRFFIENTRATLETNGIYFSDLKID